MQGTALQKPAKSPEKSMWNIKKLCKINISTKFTGDATVHVLYVVMDHKNLSWFMN